MDELLCFLVECFPEADFELLARAARLNRTREEAIDYVLAMETAIPEIDPGETLLAQLTEIFPEINVERLSKIVNEREENEDLEDLINEVIVREGTFEMAEDEPETKENWKNCLRKTRRLKLKTDSFSFKSDSFAEELKLREEQRAHAPFVYKKFTSLDIPASYDMDTTELRDEISRLLNQRRELYGKASEGYQRGGLTGSQSAVYFSEQAKSLENNIEALKLEASYRIFLKFNSDPYSRTLDLHLLTVDEAIPIMDAFLEHHISSSENIPIPVRIITGAGNHSDPQIGPRLRPAVWRRLGFSDYKFSFDGHAIFTVLGKVPKRPRLF